MNADENEITIGQQCDEVGGEEAAVTYAGREEGAEAEQNQTITHNAAMLTYWYTAYSTFLRNEQPSVSFALPPVGWHSTVEQEAQNTTVEA